MVDVAKPQRTSKMSERRRRQLAQTTSVLARKTPVTLSKAPWDEDDAKDQDQQK